MSDIVKHNAQLPADFGDSLMRGIEDTRASIVVAGGKPFLRLMRNGVWVFGQGNEEVQEGSQWAVNLASLARGWVCWGDGELLGKVMSSVQVPRPARPAAINGYEFAEQYGMDLACIDGDDAGVVVDHSNNSYGYKTMFDALVAAIRDRYMTDKVYYWPFVTLGQESYNHKKFGLIYNPILTITAWADAEGNIAGGRAKPAAAAASPQAPAAAALAEPPKPAKPRKAPLRQAPSSAQVEAAQAAPDAPPAPTQQVHTGQRRRPAAR